MFARRNSSRSGWFRARTNCGPNQPRRMSCMHGCLSGNPHPDCRHITADLCDINHSLMTQVSFICYLRVTTSILKFNLQSVWNKWIGFLSGITPHSTSTFLSFSPIAEYVLSSLVFEQRFRQIPCQYRTSAAVAAVKGALLSECLTEFFENLLHHTRWIFCISPTLDEHRVSPNVYQCCMFNS